MINRHDQQYFAVPREAQVELPSINSGAKSLACQISLDSPEKLLVNFTSSSFSLSSYDLDLKGTVYCFCAGPETLFHFYARIDKILGKRDLQMTIVEDASYPQRRKFFRVDADVVLKCWPLTRTGTPPAVAEQKKVNLSAVGLRFETTDFLKHGDKVGLELQLPDAPDQVISCVGRVVRLRFSGDELVKDVAIELVEILPAEQEKIIKFCLAEQRNQIRLKVRVLNQANY